MKLSNKRRSLVVSTLLERGINLVSPRPSSGHQEIRPSKGEGLPLWIQFWNEHEDASISGRLQAVILEFFGIDEEEFEAACRRVDERSKAKRV